MSAVTSYTTVAMLANGFAAMHVNGKDKILISPHLETELKTAQTAAKVFATQKGISCRDSLQILQSPIITLIQDEKGLWHLVTVTSVALEYLQGLDQGSTFKEADTRAGFLGIQVQCPYHPELGTLLATKKKES